MTGIVVVAHSRVLATAAVALAAEMVQGPVRIEIAAGLDETTFGTDAAAIAQAIGSADDGHGVLVLMDLGSALLSTDLALELLDDDVRSRVRLSAAPLVEGLLSAAVAAAGGATLAEVAAEAGAALTGKRAQLGETVDDESASDPSTIEVLPGAESARFTVGGPRGLHARPAARLIGRLRGLDTDVRVRNLTGGAGPVSARSLSALTALGASQGHELEVTAIGPDAETAIERVLALAADDFGDAAEEPPVDPADPTGTTDRSGTSADPAIRPGPVADGTVLHGVAASPGIGIGPAWLPEVASTPASAGHGTEPAGDPTEEWRRLSAAIDRTRDDIVRTQHRTASELGSGAAEIFDAHLLLLEDPDLLSAARLRIDAGEPGPSAWTAVLTDAGRALRGIEDDYLSTRAVDLDAVADQVLRAMVDPTRGVAGIAAADGVLVAEDLSPGEAALLDVAHVTAVVLAGGSATSHAVLLARTRGIPVVTGVGPAALNVERGTELAVDADRGEVLVAPDEDRRRVLTERIRADEVRRRAAAERSGGRARTRDGADVIVGANLGSLDDARAAAASGADLAGLVRTEFVFLGREHAPDVDEQVATYRALAAALGGRRLTLRTLDVGGDKPLPYAPVPPSANPFLGLRGLRLSLARPELFVAQLRAVVRTARETPVDLMFPMVTTVAELLEARRLLDAAVATEGGARPLGLEIGIMVEVPAVALKAGAFVPYVDFFSVGTNDLTQYALAAERGNADVAALSDPCDPGVLSLIRAVGHAAGDEVRVSVCGDLAADERAVPLLLGLGVRELSVPPRLVGVVKEAVRSTDLATAEALAAAAVAAPSASAVRELLESSGPR